jgi:hypothetical protein
MMLFLDTEWADELATELVSLALIGHDEQYVFYAERHPLPDKPMDFVRSVVYPLLQRGESAMPDFSFAARLQTFIEEVTLATDERPTIAYDYSADRGFFDYAYGGFEGRGPSLAPVDYFYLETLDPRYSLGFEAYFSSDQQAAATRHHALTDARAARAGYLAAVASMPGAAP